MHNKKNPAHAWKQAGAGLLGHRRRRKEEKKVRRKEKWYKENGEETAV